LRYPLFLLLAVLLALPPGWCCFVMTDVRATSPEPEPTDCCCCPPAPAGEEDAPARPAPRCCCGHRDVLKPEGRTRTLPDGVVEPLLPLPVVAPITPATAATAEALLLPPPLPCPLHVLRCVWLC
jgi:hypothetical protein